MNQYLLMSEHCQRNADRAAKICIYALCGVLFLCFLAWLCIQYQFHGLLVFMALPAVCLLGVAAWSAKYYQEQRQLTRIYYYESRPDLARKLG